MDVPREQGANNTRPMWTGVVTSSAVSGGMIDSLKACYVLFDAMDNVGII
jgi:hypothetical protein